MPITRDGTPFTSTLLPTGAPSLADVVLAHAHVGPVPHATRPARPERPPTTSWHLERASLAPAGVGIRLNPIDPEDRHGRP